MIKLTIYIINKSGMRQDEYANKSTIPSFIPIYHSKINTFKILDVIMSYYLEGSWYGRLF